MLFRCFVSKLESCYYDEWSAHRVADTYSLRDISRFIELVLLGQTMVKGGILKTY